MRGGVCCPSGAPLALSGDARRLHLDIGVSPPLEAEISPGPLPPPLRSGLPRASQGLGGGEQPAIDEGDGGAGGPGEGWGAGEQLAPVPSVAEVGGCSCARG